MCKDDLFICYSNNLKNKLVDSNVEYVVHGHNKNQNKDFWVFIKTIDCEKILKEWSENNINKIN